MAASRTTRRGTGSGHGGPKAGAGWGGAAKGAAELRPLGGSSDDYAESIRALARDPKHAASKALLRELYLTTLVQVAVSGEAEAARVAAADKLADRVDGKATSTTLLGGAEGAAPVAVEWHIVKAGNPDPESV